MRAFRYIAGVATLVAVVGSPAAGQTPAATPRPAQPPAQHDTHQHEPESGKRPAERPPLPPFVPPLTDEDRKAAFPDVGGHAVHERALHYFVLVDGLEWRSGSRPHVVLDLDGWIGFDRDRLWFRSEGSASDDGLGRTEGHVLYGRQVSTWWDVVAGIRQDARGGPARTWAAVGIQGLAPFWIELEVTGYVGAAGRTQARVEAETDLLLTNRLVLQPRFEVNLAGKADPERSIGRGLSTTDAGLRLRYELRRELAPYVGVTWRRQWQDTADMTRASGLPVSAARLVTGVRLWF